MRRLILGACLGSACLALAAASAAAQDRVAAIGLCADQALVALLPAERIAALSPQARDPALSVVAEQARTLPVLDASAEAVLVAGADLVTANGYGETKTIAMLERLGVPVVRVPSAESFDEAAMVLETLGQRLGVGERGQALAARLRARHAALRAVTPAETISAAYLRPDGGSAGAGTFVSAAMAAAGLDSLSTRQGQHGWVRLDLETLVMQQPDAFVISFFGPGAYSARQSFGRHPLLRRMMAERPVIEVPGRLWSCGGWPLAEAAEMMSTARREHHLP